MKKSFTILFILISLWGSGQVTQAKYTADSLIWAKRFQALENFRVTVIGGTVSPKGDSLTIALPKAYDSTFTKGRLDSLVNALQGFTKYVINYYGLSKKYTDSVIRLLPAATPFDPSKINKRIDSLAQVTADTTLTSTMDELAKSIGDLQTGKATQVQADKIEAALNRLRNYLKLIE